jgi:hypothetical protein
MRVTIWDMDFFYKLSFKPNIKAMKISSFHKQQQHLINFIESQNDLKYDFDLIYIIRENQYTPFPSSYLLDHKNTRLLGDEFKIFPNHYDMTMLINMVRPDYNLYKLEINNIYANANMIQVLSHKQKMPIRQNEENIQGTGKKLNIITDRFLWKAQPDIIKEVLDELIKYKNIFFEHPIELLPILTNEEIKSQFIKLHFAAGVNQSFRNNYGHEFEEAQNIIDLFRLIKNNVPHVSIGIVSFKTVIYEHWGELDNGIKDLQRCLKIIDYAKQQKIKIRFKSSNNRLITPFWPFFEVLDIWTEYHPYKSFIQLMLEPARRRQSLKWHEVLNNPKKWYSPRSEFLLHLLIKYPAMINKYGFRLWGNRFLSKEYIDIDKISEYAFVFNQEDIKNKLQKELIGDEAIVSGHRDNGI